MGWEIECPKCDHEFEVDWDVDRCPNCGNGIIYDEMCTEDFSDCWITVLWESNNYEY